MKSEIKVQDIELFLGGLEKALKANKAELDRIETVIWKKETVLLFSGINISGSGML